MLWFPTIQECEEGEHRWIDIPPSVEEWSEFDEPAPYVINAVAAAAGGDEPADSTETSGDPAGSSGTDDAAAAEPSNGTDPLTVVALVAGLLGLGAGAGAIVYANRRSTRPPGPSPEA